MNLLWNSKQEIKKFPKLKQDIQTDVLVIGGGIAGILIAYRLKKGGHRVVLVEKDRIGMGKTQNSTATVSCIQDRLYLDRVKEIGFEKAKKYLEANLEAIKAYQELSELYAFDYQSVPVYNYFSSDEKTLKMEYEVLKAMGLNCELVEEVYPSLKIHLAIKVCDQGVFNPVKLIANLANELTILEDTEIRKLKKNYAIDKDKHHIYFNYAVVATNYPAFNMGGKYYMKLHQLRSSVVTVKKKGDLNAAYIDSKPGGLYVREYQDYLIIGGYDWRVGCGQKQKEQLIDQVKQIYHQAIIHNFANQDCISLDEMPYIGPISKRYNNIMVATGFNAYGMSNAMISAMVLTDLIDGKKNAYASLFLPFRPMQKKNLFHQLGIAFKKLFAFGGKRCSHLGCKLNFNEEDQTYECLCHGSRFSKNGLTKDGPAKKNI